MTESTRWNTSASNVHRRVRCPGSAEAENGLPEEFSEYSKEGVELHALFSLPSAEFSPLTPDAADVSEDQFTLICRARELAGEALSRTASAFEVAPEEPFETGAERELWLTGKPDRPGLKKILPGHCDAWFYWPRLKLLLIIDAKFGFIQVDPAPLNIQLRTYAIQGAEEWDVENAVVAIIQPRAIGEGAQQLTVAAYDRPLLDMARRQLFGWRDEWEAPNAPRRPSESACRYCKAQLTCQEYRVRMLPAAILSGNLPSLGEMDDKEFSQLFFAVRLASQEKNQDALKQEALRRIAEGRMPGWKAKPNSPRGSITNHYGGIALLIDGGHLTEQDLRMCTLLHSDSLDRVLKARKGLPTLKAAEALRKELLAPVMEKKPVAPSIVQCEAEETPKYLPGKEDPE